LRDTWVEGNVDIWAWRFYSFATGVGAGNIRFEVESLDSEGDCDLYIRKGSRPTRLEYDHRNTDESADAVIDIQSASAGTWYAGVFGFYPCHYRIRVQFLGNCETPCGAHGTCEGGRCVCARGYSGPACDLTTTQMSLSTLYRGSVGSDEWKIFKLSLTQQYPAVLIHLNQTETSTEQDCDLYAKFGNVPTDLDWDYFDQNWQETYSAINLINPSTGDWFIGVYGYASCSFKIQADPQTNAPCPNQCTKRGSCRSGTCRCQIGWTGAYCEESIEPILLNQILSGYVEYDTWNFYRLDTSSTSTLKVTVSQSTASEDCDIFIRRDDKPTQTAYDFFDVSYDLVSSAFIPNPGVGTYWIGIYGSSYSSPCSYNVQASLTTQCGTCVHGECLEFGYCYCSEGWAGEGCDKAVTKLTANNVVTSTVAPRSFNFYSYTTSASTIIVSLYETQTVGYAYLFESMEISPSLTYYDQQDIDTDRSFHSITIDAQWWADPSGEYQYTYYFGVFGSPLSARDVEYKISVWASPN
jgi:hypothetical protein